MTVKRALFDVSLQAVALELRTTKRNDAIRAALKEGYSIRAVARHAGVSARTVQRIAERES